jgi:hypothetical protein
MLVETDLKFCADRRRNIISNVCILKKLSSYEKLQNVDCLKTKGFLFSLVVQSVCMQYYKFVLVLRCHFDKKTFLIFIPLVKKQVTSVDVLQ